MTWINLEEDIASEFASRLLDRSEIRSRDGWMFFTKNDESKAEENRLYYQLNKTRLKAKAKLSRTAVDPAHNKAKCLAYRARKKERLAQAKEGSAAVQVPGSPGDRKESPGSLPTGQGRGSVGTGA